MNNRTDKRWAKKRVLERNIIWILAGLIPVCMLLLIPGYAQGAEEYTLFVGELENRTGIVNPLLDYVSDTLDFLFSRSELADIRPISPGLRSAYLQRARNEQPNVDATRLALLAARYAQANAVLTGFYTKIDELWTMEIQLYVIRGDTQAREHIQLVREDMYRLLDDLAAEVGKRLGTGQYMLLSTPSWEAYRSYRQGHQAYYNFDLMGAINHFQKAIQLDPRLAVAQAELGISYAMMSMLDQAGAAFAGATKNLQYASEYEQLVVMGLESFYRHYWILGGGGFVVADMPRMRDDTVWDEPWLSWYIGITSKDGAVHNRSYEQWLVSATAYAKAGFYGVNELVNAGTEKCLDAFNATEKPQFLDVALQFIAQAADSEANDEYDDAWKHWELANIYEKMSRTEDAQQQREKWLQTVKSKPQDSLSSDAINDIARKCLEIGLPKDALEFAGKAVALESNTGIRAIYLVTLADIHLASGELNEAFSRYLEAFEIFTHGNAGTGVLADSLSGLTRLVNANPEFVDEPKRTKLNEIMRTIESMNPLLLRSDTASRTIYGVVFSSTRDFCRAVGDIGPLLTLVRGLLKAETEPSEQLVFLSYLSSFEGGVTESELGVVRGRLRAETEPSKQLQLLSYLYPFEGGIAELGLLEEDMKEEEVASLRLKYKYALFSLYQKTEKYDQAEMLVHGDIILEAEDAVSITPALRVQEDEDASNGKYITAPDTPEESEGEAEYTFQVSRPGDYKVVGRALATDDNADSFLVSIDDGEKHIWDIQQGASWEWSVVTRRRPGDSGAEPRTEGRQEGEDYIWINLGTKNEGVLLTQEEQGDGVTEHDIKAGVDCRKQPYPYSGPGDNHMYFHIDDSFLYGGSHEAWIAMEYFDVGPGVCCQYDSSSEGAFRQTDYVAPRNTKTWKSHVWHITDGRFENRCNGSDFRFSTRGGGDMWVSRVWLLLFEPAFPFDPENPTRATVQNALDLTFDLTAGQHTLRIGNREDGAKLDMIVIAPL